MDAHMRHLAGAVGLLIFRLGIGVFMLNHGAGKLNMLIDNKYDGFPDPIGLGTRLSLILAVGAEFFGSLLVIIGLGTRLAAIPLAFTMIVAAFVVHAGQPWANRELALMYLICYVTLFFTGAGRFSIDGAIDQRWRRRREQDSATTASILGRSST